MKRTLTPEQWQRLIELGVDPSKASMMRLDFNGTYAYVSGEETDIVRACVNAEYYTEECEMLDLTDILALVPKEIDGYPLLIFAKRFFEETDEVAEGWTVLYTKNDLTAAFGNESIYSALELIDVLFELLCWVLQNHPDKIEKL